MPATTVRRTNAHFAAIHSTDEDWEAVVTGWLQQYGADEEQTAGTLAQIREAVEQSEIKPWLVASPEGLGAINPADFVSDFEDVAATTTLDDVFTARMHQIEAGFDAAHDDIHGIAHLQNIAQSYLWENLAEQPDEVIKEHLQKAAATLVAGLDYLSRKEARKNLQADDA